MNPTSHDFPVGCAFLTHRNKLDSGGWASLAGAEPFKFTTLDSLRESGPLWVVSTPEPSFLTEHGKDYPFLRHAGFVPTPITSIADEIAPNALVDRDLAATRVSEILTRVLAMADTLAPVGDVLMDPAAGARTLTGAVQLLMAPILRNDPMPEELVEAMPSLFKPPAPLGGPNGNDILVRLPANRVLMAEAILGTGVPGSTWLEVGLNEYPNPLSWAMGDNKPIIARVCIKGPLPKVKANAPLMGQLTRGAVRWMALPEIMALSKIVEMRAERVFVADDMVPPSASLKIPPPAFSPAAVASISAGLFAETYLHAALSPALASSSTGEALEAPTRTHSVRAAWLLAAARALMVQEAMSLCYSGFSVVGYGATHVVVSVARRNLRNLRKAIGASSRLSYPAGLRFHEERVEEGHEVAAAQGAL